MLTAGKEIMSTLSTNFSHVMPQLQNSVDHRHSDPFNTEFKFFTFDI